MSTRLLVTGKGGETFNRRGFAARPPRGGGGPGGVTRFAAPAWR